MTSRVFTAYGQPLALNPRAFGMMIMEAPEPPKARQVGDGIAVVDVRGPLSHHPEPCTDSYDAIKARVESAINEGATKVVLSIDSPGGLVSGCFDTADEIRDLCDAKGVDLYAYVDGQTASAAYALACVAKKVFVPAAGIVGSIGIIDALVDATAQDRAVGLGFTLITSGARKADGNPHASTTDAAVASAQQRVDTLAGLFFEHVAKRRPISIEQVASLQAGLFVGAGAVQAGLADDVMSLDQVLALVRSGADVAAASAQVTPTKETNPMDDNEKAYRASLQAVVDDEKSDDKAKAKAKAILAAMDGEPDGDEPEKEEGKAEGDDEKHEEPDGDEAKAAASALAMATKALALAEATRREHLLASRPDLNDSQRKALAAVPVAALASALSAIPRAAAVPAATATVAATRGVGQGDTSAHTNIVPDADLDRAFGMAKAESPIRRDALNPVRTHFGVLTREQAKAITDKHNGGAQ